MAKVIFIIPAYNAEKTIGITIESVLHQKNIKSHIIIINHDSSDNTQSVIEEKMSKHNNITILNLSRASHHLKSPAAPLNYAFTYLNKNNLLNKETWCIRLDADDFIANDYVLSELLNEHDHFKLICAQLVFFDKRNKEAFIYGPELKYQNREGMLKKGGYAGAHHAMLFRSDFLKQLQTFPNLLNEKLHYGEDLDLTLQLFENIKEHEYFFTQKCIVFKSLHENSLSELTAKLEIWESMYQIFQLHKSLSKSLLIFLFFDLLLRRKSFPFKSLRKIFGYPAHKVGFISKFSFEEINLRQQKLNACL